MLPTYEQMKYLKPYGDDTYKFVRTSDTTTCDIAKAKEMDESYFDVYGFHVITNYKEL